MGIFQVFYNLIRALYDFMWGDLITVPLPGGGSAGLSLLVLILVPVGIFFTIRTGFVLIRMFPDILRISAERRRPEFRR